MTTWQLFIAQLPAETLPLLAEAVRATYAARPEPTSFARFLALPAGQIGETLRSAGAVRAAAATMMLAPRTSAENYDAYLAAFDTPEREAVQFLVKALQGDEIPYEDFATDWDAEKLLDFLNQRVDASFWMALAQALQTRGQKLSDASRRTDFLTSLKSDNQRAAISAALTTLDAAEPFLSLDSLGQLPQNRVAQLLWSEVPAEGQEPHDNALTRYQLQQLIGTAQAVIGENLPADAVAQELVRRQPTELQKGTEALLASINPQSQTEAIYALASTTAGALLTTTVSNLPANHPWVFGLAAWVQAIVRQYVAVNPASALADKPVDNVQQVQGLLRGQNQQPLPGFGLRITRLSGDQQFLDTLFTGPDGRFTLRFQRSYTFTEAEEVEWLPSSLGIEVFTPKQTFAEAPSFYGDFDLTPTQTEVVVDTDLSNDLPPLVSKTVEEVLPMVTELPDLQAYLQGKNLTSLADIRRAGGLLSQADAAFEEPTVREAAQRLDSLAQFEVISTDATLSNKVVDKGFTSPRQVLDTVSRAEFVQRLTPPEETDGLTPLQLGERRLEAAAFYEQAAGVEALTQALGLYAAGERRTGNVIITFPDESLEEYEPGPPAPLVEYQADNQCDCAACRSAVGPIAYLAAMLNYAVTKLNRQPTSGPTESVTATTLQDTFQQPFCDLPVSCQYAEEPVCQYRLAIEVLRTPLNAPLPLADAKPYVTAVYNALLQSLGTSGPELQQATQAPARAALATRLRVTPDMLEDLQAAYEQRDTATSLAVVEADLEQLFGLPSTSRDALSTGSKKTSAGSGQLERWTFQGIEPGVNTNANGELYLEVLPSASPKPVLTVRTQLRSQFASETALADTVVATGILVPDATTMGLYRAMLYPQHDSGLRGTAVLRVSGAPTQVEFTVVAVPAVTTGRLQVLSQEWQAQDADAASALHNGPAARGWNGFPFIIDPDVIGPDDIRPKQAGSSVVSRAYRIWKNRFNFLQSWPVDANQPLGDLINALSPPMPVNSQPTYTPVAIGTTSQAAANRTWTWNDPAYPNTLWGTQLLDAIAQDLRSSNAPFVACATSALTSIGLSLEAFQRLQDLRRADPATGSAGHNEGLDILRQTLKKAFAQVWVTEELPGAGSANDPDVTLSGLWFRPAVHEPKEGAWAALRGDAQQRPVESPTEPLIDPDVISPLDLPDPGLGTAAQTLWQARKAALQVRQQAILDSGASIVAPAARADAMLRYAYHYTDIFSTEHSLTPAPFATWDALYDAYQDEAAEQHSAAVNILTVTLKLTPDEVARFLALRAQAVVSPAESLWVELASVLVRGWKRALAYAVAHQYTLPNGGTPVAVSSWAGQESSVLDDNPFAENNMLITSRKQRLPKWRASAAARARWTAALAQAYTRPIIDPDQLVVGDFRQAGAKKTGSTTTFSNLAYAFYAQRLAQVNTWFNEAATTQTDIAAALGTSTAELTELLNLRRANGDVSGLLRRVGLTPNGLDLLDEHLAAGGPDRSQEVRHLLAQVQRERHYADWRRQEVAAGIFLSPLLFREPQSEAAAPVVHPWRSSQRERRLWQQQLTARFEQTRATVTAQTQAVKTAEDQYLPLLRDAMLDKLVVAGATSREAKADALGARYLLDFKVACCQHTTRVAQAIDVLQKVFFNHRHGLLNTATRLVLDADAAISFDNEWQWLSSYERWRSLMFLYLYPENVLLPALKPQQTTQFHNIINQIRQGPGLTPATAKAYLATYEKHLQDVNTLQIQASTQTYLDLAGGSTTGSLRRQHVVFQVGVSAVRTAYWNMAIGQNPVPGATQNYRWTPINSSRPVHRVVGATVFQNASQERLLLVFAFLRTGKTNPDTGKIELQLGIQKLALATNVWDEDFSDLTLNGDGALEESNVVLVERRQETWLPLLVGIRNRVTDVPLTYLNARVQTNLTPAYSGETLEYVVGHPFARADVFTARLNDDCSSVATISSNMLLGFNDVVLWSGLSLTRDMVLLIMAQKIGPDNTGYEFETLTLDNTYNEGYQSAGYDRLTNLLVISKRYTQMTSPTSRTNIVYTRLGGFVQYVGYVYSTQRIGITKGAAWMSPTPEQTTPLVLGNAPVFVGQRLISLDATNNTGFDNFRNTYELYFRSAAGSGTGTRKITFTVKDRYDFDLVGIHNQNSHVYWGTNLDADVFSPYVADTLTQTYRHVGSLAVTAVAASEAQLLPSFVTQTDAVVTGSVVSSVTLGATSSVCTYVSLAELPGINTAVSRTNLTTRKQQLQALFAVATGSLAPPINNLLWEAYCHIPLQIALELTRSKYYEEALSYFRLVYDYTQVSGQRTVFPVLSGPPATGTTQAYFNDVMSWLTDASNPHTIAGLRAGSYQRFVVVSVVRCLLGYADAEFTRDTSESVPRARSLYELASGLLRQDIVDGDVQDCRAILNQVDPIIAAAWLPEWEAMKDLLALVNQREVILNLLQDRATTPVTHGLIWLFSQARYNGNWDVQFGRAWQMVNAQLLAYVGRYETLCSSQAAAAQLAAPGPLSLPRGITTELSLLESNMLDAVRQEVAAQLKVRFANVVEQIRVQTGQPDYAWLAAKTTPQPDTPTVEFPPAVLLQLATNTSRPYVPFLGAGFCVPTNPVPYSLLLQAELNLYKIRTCRNIAGVQRELDPYAAPTDTTTGMPVIGANGQLARSGRLVVPATQYRYAYIMERARQLVSLAQQAESALLSALEKRDAESYSLLKARQDIAVSRATVQLQDLKITEAEDGIDLANLQLQRSELMEDQYEAWISGGLSEFEENMLEVIKTIGVLSAVQSGLQATASALGSLAGASTFTAGIAITAAAFSLAAGGVGAAVALKSSDLQILQNRASFDRRNQEWTFQKNLAGKDVEIGQQQIRLAGDRLRIVGQEKRISELQLDHAEAVLNFLTTKFTNAELYDWMSQILESAYSYFLQQATATARTAELQLAFERQEVPAGLIQQDYWTPPTDAAGATAATDRKGLTGSVRLLEDLTRLDQYAFETNRRKMQLTKTVSLAQAFPTEFVRFRETGVLPFALPQQVFDADFPGQYLRIIRRVRTSVIALVPPVEGIKARLSTAGVSRVVVDGTPFQTLTLPRQPEAVALTSPMNATGLFELEQQPGELLYPFEGMGVDVPWTFSMQKAANGSVNYGTIADVLITLEYTALESATYAQQVAQALGTAREQMLAFSLRNQFADQWYDLHHAADLAPDDQYVARFTIRATDLPANLRDVRLKSLSLYVDAPTDDAFTDRTGLEMVLTRGTGSGGTAQTNQYGLISTRTGTGTGPLYTGNAAALVPLLGASPVGDWTLSLGPDAGNRLRARLDQGKVEDIYLILEVEGDVPAYTLV